MVPQIGLSAVIKSLTFRIAIMLECSYFSLSVFLDLNIAIL